MGWILLFAMIAVPILEITVFIEVGGWIGLWPTLATVLLTAVIGTALLRIQGFSTIARAQQSLDAGRFPITEVFDGLCIVFGGALLLTPGFVTDAVGLALLLPPVRVALRRLAGRYLVAAGKLHVQASTASPGSASRNSEAGPVIDGEFEEVRDDDSEPDSRKDPSRNRLR